MNSRMNESKYGHGYNDPVCKNHASSHASDRTSDSRGLLITFEGGEGVGKSTQILLLKARLEAAGAQVLHLREPGGTKISESIRDILLDPAHTEMDDITELLLYEAARAQLVSQVITPALAQGAVVLCDRFTDSTLAYQGSARGLGFDLVDQVNRIGSLGVVPDRTVVIVHDLEESLERATQEGADRLEAEGLGFHKRVHEGFAQLATLDPNRVRVVTSHENKAQTAAAVFEQVVDLFPQAAALDFPITPELIERVRNEHD